MTRLKKMEGYQRRGGEGRIREKVQEIKNKHSSRPVGGAETGSRGGEDSSCSGGTKTGGVWDKWGRQSDH